MDVEQLMKLIDKVSESDLTGFKYEENGIKLQLNKKENLVMGTTAAVQAVTPEIEALAGGAGSALGTGGMATKLSAAKRCAAGGVEMVIANGADPRILYDIVEGRTVGTRFSPAKQNLQAGGSRQ